MFDRRTFLRSAGLTVAAVGGIWPTSGLLANATESAADGDSGAIGRFDKPQQGFLPSWTSLRYGSPSSVGLDSAPIDAVLQQIHQYTVEPDPKTGYPLFPGAVVLLAHQGTIVTHSATGWALRYSDYQGDELPVDQRIAMRPDTIFDMASISKLFTSTVCMQLVERGLLDVSQPVAKYLPGYAVNGKGDITIEMVLTHTSGLQPDPNPSLWQGYPDIPSRRKAILNEKPINPPGSTYLYSDLNMLSVQLLVEHVTGKPLDVLVREGITAPLGMSDTGYNPPASKKQRIAPTEFQLPANNEPNRGLVWGQVHDENAWALGGVAGHAGVFSTAHDMAVLCQAFLGGGSYHGRRILRQETVQQMITNYNQRFPGDDHGLGFELNQIWYNGGVTGHRTAGHTGFTGTTLVLDFDSRSIVLLLDNRVHPNRNGSSTNLPREQVGTAMSRALAVRPVVGRDSWFSKIGNASTATLTTPALTPRGSTLTVSHDAFLAVEDGSDYLYLESSTDGTNWQQVKVQATGTGAPTGDQQGLTGNARAWWQVTASLAPAQGIQLRWRYTTDPNYTGRGVNLDGIRISDDAGVLLDAERDPSALTANGWALVSR